MNREELLQKYAEPIRVLDHGYVRLVDVMGDDLAIEEAARISYDGGRGRKVSDRRALLRYLFRHRHTSPYEMAEIKIGMKLPIFVARQIIRHRTANVNEMSGRYSELPAEFYVPDNAHLAYQSADNKQGRSKLFPREEAEQLREQMRGEASEAFATYSQFLEADMAKELARINLPLGTYTEWYWKIDLRNLFHFLGLRLDKHAQYEVRVYAEALWTIVQDWCPLAAEAFVDYELEAEAFSRMDLAMLRDIVADWKSIQDDLCVSEHKDPKTHLDWLISEMFERHGLDNKRERQELLAKLGLV